MKPDYLKILSLFTFDQVSIPAREWMSKPFHYGNYTCATNAECLVAIPRISEDYEVRDIGLVYPVERNCDSVIDKVSLYELCRVNFSSSRECSACKGMCVVNYVFEHDGEYYDVEAECPVCEGSGEESVINYCEIDKSVFDIAHIHMVAQVAMLFDSELRIVSKRDYTFLFAVADVEMLIMKQGTDLLKPILFSKQSNQ